MCGIYGCVALGGAPLGATDRVAAISAGLRHRGPDADATWQGEHAVLGCRRLRIVDLSPAADQPFSSPDGRYHVVCNGEIYNHLELRRRHPDHPYRSHSDVETIVPLVSRGGVAALRQLEGMFAVAVWDAREQRLTVARDRAGEKPLFVTRSGGLLWFASEVQPLLEVAEDRGLDESALREFLSSGVPPQPRTAFRSSRKVAAGALTTFSAAGETVESFWPDAEAFAAAGIGEGDALDAATAPSGVAAEDELDRLLQLAVRSQLQGDQPIGLFLSGGIDSSLLAASFAGQLAAARQSERLTSYAAKFVGAGCSASYDEEEWAESVALRFGFEHRAVPVDEHGLQRSLEAICDRIAEPIADPAILPTYLLAERARREVPGVLGGEGADELFGGYPTYLGHRFASRWARLPRLLRRPIEAGVGALPASRSKVSLEFLLKRFLLAADQPWRQRHRRWLGPDAAVLLAAGAPASAAAGGDEAAADDVARLIEAPRDEFVRAMRLDYFGYLRENLLVKLDRACMLHSVESRAPYLDTALTRFAWSLAPRQLIRGRGAKALLSQGAQRRRPKKLAHRRKRGLSVPIATWIDGGLGREVDRLLDRRALSRQGLFDADATSGLLAAHRSGRVDASRTLWSVIVLQKWLERWSPGDAI